MTTISWSCETDCRSLLLQISGYYTAQSTGQFEVSWSVLTLKFNTFLQQALIQNAIQPTFAKNRIYTIHRLKMLKYL